MKRRTLIAGAGAAAGLGCLPSLAQEKFPSKPIEVVTHSGAGGGTDITARMMMVHAPGIFGTELIVANRVGGAAPRRSHTRRQSRATATRSCSSPSRTCSRFCRASRR